jgi:hypothetical protein
MLTRCKMMSSSASLIAGTVASVLAACASTSVRPAGAVAALAPPRPPRSDAALRGGAPLVTQASAAAAHLAEQPRANFHQDAYRVPVADQKVGIVRAQVEIRLAEVRRPRLRTETRKARLDARTRELDLAQSQAVLAELEGAEQTLAAIAAGGEAAASDRAAAISDQQASAARREAECAELAASLSRQPTARQPPGADLLQASISGSGLVVTLAGFAVFR